MSVLDYMPESMRARYQTPQSSPPGRTVFDYMPDSIRGHYSQEMQDAARRPASAYTEDTGEFIARRAFPFASTISNALETRAYTTAKARLEAGGNSQSDRDTVHVYEQRQQHEQNAGVGHSVLSALATIPAIAGEAALGGAAAGGLGLAGSAAAEGSTFLGRAATAAMSPAAYGRNAFMTAVMPSMWLPQWSEGNARAGRDALDPRGLPSAYAMGFLNTAVLGSMQAGEAITGDGILTAARRTLTKVTGGMWEQQMVDVLASAVSEVLPDAYKLQTGYGLVGALLRDPEEAMKHAITQAVTFGAFAVMHGDSPKEFNKHLKETLDAAHKEGLPKKDAAERLREMFQPREDLPAPEVQGGQTPADPNLSSEGMPRGPAFGGEMRNEVPTADPLRSEVQKSDISTPYGRAYSEARKSGLSDSAATALAERTVQAMQGASEDAIKNGPSTAPEPSGQPQPPVTPPEAQSGSTRPGEPLIAKPGDTVDRMQQLSIETGKPIRLFRGEGALEGKEFTKGSAATGGWFDLDLSRAERYAKENNGSVYYIDIPPDKEVWKGIIHGANGKTELILPPELAARKQPLDSATAMPAAEQRTSIPEMFLSHFQGNESTWAASREQINKAAGLTEREALAFWGRMPKEQGGEGLTLEQLADKLGVAKTTKNRRQTPLNVEAAARAKLGLEASVAEAKGTIQGQTQENAGIQEQTQSGRSDASGPWRVRQDTAGLSPVKKGKEKLPAEDMIQHMMVRLLTENPTLTGEQTALIMKNYEKLTKEFEDAKAQASKSYSTQAIAEALSHGLEPGTIAEANGSQGATQDIYYHGGQESSTPTTGERAPGQGIGPHEIINTIENIFNTPSYSGKVPGGADAAAIISTRQVIKEGMAKGDVGIAIEEMFHHQVKDSKIGTSPDQLPPLVRDQLMELLPQGAKVSEESMVEGLSQWMIRRTAGQLDPSHAALNSFGESFLQSQGLTAKWDLIKAMVAQQGGAEGLISATGKGVDKTKVSMLEQASDLLINRFGPAVRFVEEANRLLLRRGSAAIAKGKDLLATITGTHFQSEPWAQRMEQEGLFSFRKNEDGSRTEVKLAGPLKELTQGFDAADLAPQGKGASRLGTFILGRSVVREVETGHEMLAREMEKPKELRDQSIIDESYRKINTASPDQVAEFRKNMEREQALDPAWFQKAMDAADRYTQYNSKILEARVLMGTMSDGQKNAWEAAHPDYVSLVRVMDTGDHKTDFNHQRHGSARQFVDPFVTIRDRLNKLAAEHVKALVYESLYESGQHEGSGQVGVSSYFREISEPGKQARNRVELEKSLEALGYDQAERESLISLYGDKAVEQNTPWRDGATNTVSFMYEGQRKTIEVLNRPLYELLTDKNGTSNPIVKAAAAVAGFPGLKQAADAMKFGATSGSMAFQTRNILRDIWTFMQNAESKSGLASGYAEAYKNKFKQLFGMEVDPTFKSYSQAGGEQLRAYSFDAMHHVNKGRQVLELMGAGEHGPRFAEYRNALEEMGFTKEKIATALEANPNESPIPLQAQLYARERAAKATVDFSATGSAVHEANKVVPFLGAHMASMTQEINNWQKAVKEMSKGEFGPKAKSMMGVLGVYLGAEILHWWAHKNDEWYNELPAHLRHNWWVLGKDSQDRMWGVPKPQGIVRMVGAWLQETLRAGSGSDPRFGMAANTAYQTGVPRLMPMGVGEAIELSGNKSWSGQPIVPRSAQNEEAFDNMLRYQLPYVLEQFTGGLASVRNVQRAYDSEASMPERVSQAVRSPVQGFIASSTSPHQSVEDFYNLHGELERAHNRATQRGERFDRDSDYKALERAKTRMDTLSAEMRGMRTRGNGGRVQEEMPSEARRREIASERLRIAQEALQRVR